MKIYLGFNSVKLLLVLSIFEFLNFFPYLPTKFHGIKRFTLFDKTNNLVLFSNGCQTLVDTVCFLRYT